jgi:DNA-binding NarL/FixJ family response regulator
VTLNEREKAIVTGLAQGKTLKEIAWELQLSHQWTRVQVRIMRQTLGYRTTEQLMWELSAKEKP